MPCLPMPCNIPVKVCTAERNNTPIAKISRQAAAFKALSCCCGYRSIIIGRASTKIPAAHGIPVSIAVRIPRTTLYFKKGKSPSLRAAAIAGTMLAASACVSTGGKFATTAAKPESCP